MSQPPPQALADWLQVFMYLIVSVTAVVVLVKHFTGRIPKTAIDGQIEVREAATFATKPDLAAAESRLGGEIHQLHGRVTGVRNEAETKIAGVRAEVKALDERIDAIPQRTIELLRTVKEYHKA